MNDQYLPIEIIRAIGQVAKAFDRIADAIEHRTDKMFPNPIEEILHEERMKEMHCVIERKMRKRAEQIIAIKNLKCKHCIVAEKVKTFPAFCATRGRDVFGDDIACVHINPNAEGIQIIEANDGIKLNTDGEVIP